MTHTIVENNFKYYFSNAEIKNAASVASDIKKKYWADYIVDLTEDSIIKSRATKEELVDAATKIAPLGTNQYCVSFRAPDTRVETICGALKDLPVGFQLVQYRYLSDKWIVQIRSDLELDESAWETRIGEILTRYRLCDVIAFRIE